MSIHKDHNNPWDKRAYWLIEKTQLVGKTSNETSERRMKPNQDTNQDDNILNRNTFVSKLSKRQNNK